MTLDMKALFPLLLCFSIYQSSGGVLKMVIYYFGHMETLSSSLDLFYKNISTNARTHRLEFPLARTARIVLKLVGSKEALFK